MLTRIISGGQTGVDRAALDAAIKMGIEHGGWIPRGRLTEEGPLSVNYAMQETDSSDYAERTAKNVASADATLIIAQGPLTGGTALTLRLAKESRRPWLHVDLQEQAAFQAAVTISKWLNEHEIEILNVAGPRASKDPEIYAKTLKLLETVCYLELVHAEPNPAGAGPGIGGHPGSTPSHVPRTALEAADRLIAEMALKDRVTLANMAEIELPGLSPTLGAYVLKHFQLEAGNARLLEACRWEAGSMALTTREAAALIIRNAWKQLRKTHKLRVV